MELELAALLALAVVGLNVFAPFATETPPWRKILKWVILSGVVLGSYQVIGHWSLVLLLALIAAGAVVHWSWCRRHQIHPLRATPRRRYYQLRGWRWEE
jgi:hypothetical protein